LNYTRDKRLNYGDSHHCVTGLLRTFLCYAFGPAALRATVPDCSRQSGGTHV